MSYLCLPWVNQPLSSLMTSSCSIAARSSSSSSGMGATSHQSPLSSCSHHMLFHNIAFFPACAFSGMANPMASAMVQASACAAFAFAGMPAKATHNTKRCIITMMQSPPVEGQVSCEPQMLQRKNQEDAASQCQNQLQHISCSCTICKTTAEEKLGGCCQPVPKPATHQLLMHYLQNNCCQQLLKCCQHATAQCNVASMQLLNAMLPACNCSMPLQHIQYALHKSSRGAQGKWCKG